MITFPACRASNREQPKLDRRQVHGRAVDRHLVTCLIDPGRSDDDLGLVVHHVAARATERDVDAREQLARAERLGDVVINEAWNGGEGVCANDRECDRSRHCVNGDCSSGAPKSGDTSITR